MNIVVKSDYDGYFERLTNRIVDLVVSPKFDTVIVEAKPFVPDALNVTRIDDNTVCLLFYSALRSGFGSLSEEDIKAAAEMLSNVPAVWRA